MKTLATTLLPILLTRVYALLFIPQSLSVRSRSWPRSPPSTSSPRQEAAPSARRATHRRQEAAPPARKDTCPAAGGGTPGVEGHAPSGGRPCPTAWTCASRVALASCGARGPCTSTAQAPPCSAHVDLNNNDRLRVGLLVGSNTGSLAIF